MEFTFTELTQENESLLNKISNVSPLFMHTAAWATFQKALGKKVNQYLIYTGETLVGYLYIENNFRKLARYAYSPFGPLVDLKAIEGHVCCLAESLAKFAKIYMSLNELNVFRFDPFKWSESLEKDLLNNGFSRTKAAVGPKYMWEISLDKSEDELLADMKKVARYNIKQSEKAGIEIVKASEQSNQEELVKEFYKILEETTKRQGFASFDWLYFQRQAEILGLGNECELYLAKYNGQYVSCAWVNYSNDTVSYTHGGSIPNPEIQKFGASYLLHWTIIKDSKSKGFKFYNMWGVVPNEELGIRNEKLKNHPLRGVSDFKMRFGGHLIENIGGFEITSNPVAGTLNRLYDLWVYRNDRV